MRAVVTGTQAEQMSEARRILLSEGVDCQAGDVVAYDRLPDSLAATLPDVVLVFCNGSLGESLAAIQTAHQLAHGPVLAVGEPGVSLVRDAMRAGAREFIDINNLRQDLSAAVVNIENVNQSASKRGRIVSVFSPVGGSGVSTIALNLAISMLRMKAPAKRLPPKRQPAWRCSILIRLPAIFRCCSIFRPSIPLPTLAIIAIA